MKKAIVRLCTVLMVCVLAAPVTPLMTEAAEQLNTKEVLLSVERRGDVIGWEYKVVGNMRYRRKYNYTKREWIGDWEFVGYV